MRDHPDWTPLRHPARARRVPAQAAICALTLTAGAAVGLCLLYTGTPAAPVVVATPARAPAAIQPLRRAASMLDLSFTAPSFTAGTKPATFAQAIALRASFQPRVADVPPREDLAAPVVASLPVPLPPVAAALIPVPPSRPALRLATLPARPEPSGRRRMAAPVVEASAAAAGQPEQPGFFDRMFGRAATAPGSALAYASPEAGLGASRAPERATAVYDISAHVVTLPDGTRLEAHSGLGASKDDPRSVAQHMRGATPPALYELTPREALFHGVAALRLTPVGGNPYGRAGLLAHTYMLGPKGDSNGCVVFRDYRAFREAYDRGLVRRLVVVARGS